MNYKLAKQLKEAGFPGIEWMTDGGGEPTLSELIEAVGDKFGRLEKTESNWKCLPKPSDNLDWTVGETPSEAVAKLYLKLNQ